MTGFALSLAQQVGFLLTPICIALVALIRARPATMQIGANSDASLRTDLMMRIAALESRVAGLETENRAQRAAHELEVRAMELRHSEVMQAMRDELAHESHTLDQILFVIEQAPDKLAEVIPAITARRRRKKGD